MNIDVLNIDPWYLFLSLVFSVIGWGYFRYGKRLGETAPMIVGVLLMVYPYFIPICSAWLRLASC